MLVFQPPDEGTGDEYSEFDPLTEAKLGWFHLFSGIIKHFVTHVENTLLISADLTLPMVNSITPILALIRQMVFDKTKNRMIIDLLLKKSHFLSALNQLMDKWPGKSLILVSFCIFDNYYYF